MRLSFQFAAKAGALFLSMFMGLIIVDFYFAITKVESRAALARAAKEQNVAFDKRALNEVVQALRAEKKDVYPLVIPPSILKKGLMAGSQTITPLAHASNQDYILCNEEGSYPVYKTDEHGFQNPAGAWSRLSVDAGVIGDSYAFGNCVPQGNSFADLIRGSGVSIVNAGIPGAGPLMELAIAKEYLENVRPKKIIWAYYEGNDIADLKAELQTHYLAKYRDPRFRQGLSAYQKEIDEALGNELSKMIAEKNDESRKATGTKLNSEKIKTILKLGHLRSVLGLTVTSYDAEVKELREILKEIKRFSAAWNGTVVFLYLPEWNRYKGLRPTAFGRLREPVLRAVKEAGIPVIDIHEAFEKNGDPLSNFPFRQYGHYNQKGNKIVAETILNSMTSQSTQ